MVVSDRCCCSSRGRFGEIVSSQLERWQGEFGREYHDRNQVDWRTRVDGFRAMIPKDVRSVLEVGCGPGHNMLALQELGLRVYGYEPNKYARDQAISHGLGVFELSVYDLPSSTRVDLVMTSGVLIHVPSDRLGEAMRNVHDSARRYILAVEYAGDGEPVEYRGEPDMLWPRDYGSLYQTLFPRLELVGTGTDVSGFEGATWWLLKK